MFLADTLGVVVFGSEAGSKGCLVTFLPSGVSQSGVFSSRARQGHLAQRLELLLTIFIS